MKEKIKITSLKNCKRIPEVVDVHMASFSSFFLTFLGKNFLKYLYCGFVKHPGSGLFVAVNNRNQIVVFLAYSDDLSGFYKFLIKQYLVPFVWYGGCACLRRPKIFFRLLRAFRYPSDAKREESYVELSSIGVLPEISDSGIGKRLIQVLKQKTDWKKYEYIKLETDAEKNEKANQFYWKNGFVLNHSYETPEGRKMNEYRYYLK